MAASANYVFWLLQISNIFLYKVDIIVTWQKWLLDGLVFNLWIVCRSGIQNGGHEETKFNIGPYGNFLFLTSFQKPVLDYYYDEKQADSYQAMC